MYDSGFSVGTSEGANLRCSLTTEYTHKIPSPSNLQIRFLHIINTRYVVEGRFAEATLTDKGKTLTDAMEDIISDEFTDLTVPKEEPKIKPKPVRSTAGKER